jgi:uncharacterized protein (TIGR00369 family)
MRKAETKGIVRSRTITWDDPEKVTGPAKSMSGLDYLTAMKNGKIPLAPISHLVNFRFVDVEEGRVLFEIVPAEYHFNPFSTMHAGITCTLLDSAMACAVHSLLPAGVGYTTLEIKLNLVRPITLKSGRMRCEGKVIHAGNSIATAEARMTDRKGKLYAHAVSTCMIFQSGWK